MNPMGLSTCTSVIRKLNCVSTYCKFSQTVYILNFDQLLILFKLTFIFIIAGLISEVGGASGFRSRGRELPHNIMK